MNIWKGSRNWFLVCEAALLSDSDAVLYLHEALQRRPVPFSGRHALLAAIAWLDPEGARERYDILGERGKDPAIPQIWFQSNYEAQRLRAETEEYRTAYAALAALMPDRSYEAQKRQGALGLVCARRSLEEFVALPNWESYADMFLFARIWLTHPEALGKRSLGLGPSPILCDSLYNPIGQFMLGARKAPADIPRLVALVEELCKKATGLSEDLAYAPFFQALGALEECAPAELCRLLPDLVAAACRGVEPERGEVLARLLVQVVRFQLDTSLLLPLKETILKEPYYPGTIRSLRRMRRFLPDLTSEVTPVLRLMRLFHLFSIARRIKGTLKVREGESVESPRVLRARRRLNRCQRFIDSVEFSFWREQLQEELNNLQEGLA